MPIPSSRPFPRANHRVQRFRLASLGAAFVLLPACAAHATPFRYTESFNGSGRLGSKSYTNTLVSISVLADSSDVTDDGDGFFENGSSQVTVTIGNATYTLSGVSAAASSQEGQGSLAGLAIFGTSILEVGTDSASFAAYDLSTAIGPIVGHRDGYVNTGGSFKTTTPAVSVSFSSVGSSTTFTAAPVAADVPEPTSLLLMGTGAVGSAALLRRRAFGLKESPTG